MKQILMRTGAVIDGKGKDFPAVVIRDYGRYTVKIRTARGQLRTIPRKWVKFRMLCIYDPPESYEIADLLGEDHDAWD